MENIRFRERSGRRCGDLLRALVGAVSVRKVIESFELVSLVAGNRGKTPGKQVQHASACETAAAEIRHFLAVEPGLTRFRSVFARGFAPVTSMLLNSLNHL